MAKFLNYVEERNASAFKQMFEEAVASKLMDALEEAKVRTAVRMSKEMSKHVHEETNTGFGNNYPTEKNPKARIKGSLPGTAAYPTAPNAGFKGKVPSSGMKMHDKMHEEKVDKKHGKVTLKVTKKLMKIAHKHAKKHHEEEE